MNKSMVRQRGKVGRNPVPATETVSVTTPTKVPDGNGSSSNGSGVTSKPSLPANGTGTTKIACPWMELEDPAERSLKVYALDPSASSYAGNVMTLNVPWEDLLPGPVGHKIAVIDYDAANNLYYPPVDLNDPRILARDGLEPTESDPRFHQQMVYAVASETINRFEVALGRKIHWRRADRPPVSEGGPKEKLWNKKQDIWRLNLFPHAMIQANAFYSPEAKGILFGYFTAAKKNQGDNLPGQRVFTCLSHDIIAHEVTHAIVDGIRTYFTEPTNPDVLAFHEAFADLTALFAHFSHKEALIDVIHRTGGLLYRSIIKPEVTPDGDPVIAAEISTRNSFIDLAKQFGQASGMGRGLRSALGVSPSPDWINQRINDVHFRGAILVSAVFDAYFTIYIKRTAALMRVYKAAGGRTDDELPATLDELLADQAASIASEFFTICVRALDYCPPVDLTFGDFLRALITVHLDQTEEEGREVRLALMQAFRLRGIYADSAFFSQDSLCWPRERWIGGPDDVDKNYPTALPPLYPKQFQDKNDGPIMLRPVFGSTSGMTKEEKDINGTYFRQYALDNAARLGFDADPNLPLEMRPYAPSFHSVFRMLPNGSLRTQMVVELVQSTRVPFDPKMPAAGSFPFRAGVTLIIAAPKVGSDGKLREAEVRYAIRKTMRMDRADRQRDYHLAMGMADGDVDDPNHFQANFGLLHQGF
jgi:hypothetical protein